MVKQVLRLCYLRLFFLNLRLLTTLTHCKMHKSMDFFFFFFLLWVAPVRRGNGGSFENYWSKLFIFLSSIFQKAVTRAKKR